MGESNRDVRTLRLTLAYDGTGFCGWQLQPGQPTVQGVLEQALATVLDEPRPRVTAAGRTDSGVHALAQVAHVRTASAIGCTEARLGLNSLLPHEVRVREVREAPASFDARRAAWGKEYRYHWYQGDPVPPFLARYCVQVRRPLDVAAMDGAARLLEGTHDLSALRAASCSAASAVRTVASARVAQSGPLVVFAIAARSFLQHMVRISAAVLLEVGKGRLAASDLAALIAGQDRRRGPATAPARGLFLVRVVYGREQPLAASPEPVLTLVDAVG